MRQASTDVPQCSSAGPPSYKYLQVSNPPIHTDPLQRLSQADDIDDPYARLDVYTNKIRLPSPSMQCL